MSEFDIAIIEDSSLATKVSELLNPTTVEKAGDMLEDLEERLDYAGIYQPSTTSVEQTGIHETLKVGGFYTKYSVLGDVLTGSPLAMWNSRGYFDRTSSKQVCSSPDGKTPRTTEIAEECKTCKFSKFSRGKPSPCTKFLNILFQPEDLSSRPFVLQFSKTSYKTGMDLVRQAKSFGDNIFDSTFTIKTTKVDGYSYRKPIIEDCSHTEDKMKPIYGAIQEHYSLIVQKTVQSHLVSDDEEMDEIETPVNIA